MRRLLGTALLLGAFAASAESTTPPARPDCKGAEHHQFDFWIGTWTVQNPQGEREGENTIEPIQKGCALRESWTGAEGSSGTSLNFYDRGEKKWHQTWIDASGGPLYLDGSFDAGKMVLTGERPRKDGGRAKHRISWEPLKDGRVRQLWETSKDGGKTWETSFDGYYTKK